PQLITAAAELIAKFSAALISHLPDLLNCGAALLTTLVDGIIRSIENLGEAALACIAKLTGVWDGSMDEWGHIGENIVTGLLNGITGMWDTLVSTVKGKVSGMVSTVKNVLGITRPRRCSLRSARMSRRALSTASTPALQQHRAIRALPDPQRPADFATVRPPLQSSSAPSSPGLGAIQSTSRRMRWGPSRRWQRPSRMATSRAWACGPLPISGRPAPRSSRRRFRP
ncbi:MAG: hypothetical protein ACLTYN_14710, partial [Dysosmobacter welbionis]